MATMIPETISPAAPPSEQLVFRLLRDDPAADGWVVIHSSGHGVDAGRPREIDFLVLIPNYGILCVEVKGGGFRVENGQWRSRASGQPVEHPVRQAENAMYALKSELARQFGASSDVAHLPLDCAVVFTDVDWLDGIRRPPRPVIDYSDLRSNLSLGGRLQAAALRMRPAAGRRAGAPPLTAAMANRLRQYLAPDFTMELVAAVGPQLDIIDDQLIRLTEEQYAALDLARDNDRCLFRGAAGTGKTMLALECARRAATAGHRVALGCYNRLLGHWLAQQTQGVAGIAAGAFWDALMRPVIVGSPVGPDFAAAEQGGVAERDWYEQVYPEYARRALRHAGPQFDVLILDEAQDLCQSPYLELLDLALAGGLAQGRWAMLGDFTNQAIYLSQAADPERALLEYFPHPARRNLYINCRNTPPIARDTARVAGYAAPETRLREVPAPHPQYLYWQDTGQLSDLLDEEVHRLLGQDVRIGEIAVLATGRLENTGLDVARSYGSYPLADYSRGQRLHTPATDSAGGAGSGPHLKFCTVQSFKGLESNVVILILGSLRDRPFDAANAYIGMSRARGALTVLAQAGLQSEVEARLGD